MELARWSDSMLHSASLHGFDGASSERIQSRYKTALSQQNAALLTVSTMPIVALTGLLMTVGGGLITVVGILQLLAALCLAVVSVRLMLRSTEDLRRLRPELQTLPSEDALRLPRWEVEVRAEDADVVVSLLRRPVERSRALWLSPYDPFVFNHHSVIADEMRAAGYEPVGLEEQPEDATMVVASERIPASDEERVYDVLGDFRGCVEAAEAHVRDRLTRMVEAEMFVRSLQSRID